MENAPTLSYIPPQRDRLCCPWCGRCIEDYEPPQRYEISPEQLAALSTVASYAAQFGRLPNARVLGDLMGLMHANNGVKYYRNLERHGLVLRMAWKWQSAEITPKGKEILRWYNAKR